MGTPGCRLLLVAALAGCSSAPGPFRSAAVTAAHSTVHLTWSSASGMTAPSGALEIAGGECAASCALSVSWMGLSFADFDFAGHTARGAGVTLDHSAGGMRFADGTFLVSSAEVAATFHGTLDGAPVTAPLTATAPLAGVIDPATGAPQVTADLQSADGSLLLHLLLETQ